MNEIRPTSQNPPIPHSTAPPPTLPRRVEDTIESYPSGQEESTICGRLSNAWYSVLHGVICTSGFCTLAIVGTAMATYHAGLSLYLVAKSILFGEIPDFDYYRPLAHNLRNLADAIEENFTDRRDES